MMQPNLDLTYVAAGVDVIASLLCVIAMQVITVRGGEALYQTQRFAFGLLSLSLLFNGLSNPALHWFGDHHLAGFFIDCCLLFALSVFCMRGLAARKVDRSFRVEEHKQPADHFKDLVGNGTKGVKQ